MDIKGTLEREFGLPVTVANDANCMLLGEVWAGAAKGYTDVIGVTLGTGVGGGILTGGVSAQQELLIDPLAEKVRASVMHAFRRGSGAKVAALQNDAGLVGAVYYSRKSTTDLLNHRPKTDKISPYRKGRLRGAWHSQIQRILYNIHQVDRLQLAGGTSRRQILYKNRVGRDIRDLAHHLPVPGRFSLRRNAERTIPPQIRRGQFFRYRDIAVHPIASLPCAASFLNRIGYGGKYNIRFITAFSPVYAA